MVSKSASDTLETLKVVLSDIGDMINKHANENTSKETNKGLKLLCQIKNTMSDRAATETKFNEMLETYRKECLPLYMDGLEEFTQEAKEKLSEINNFFLWAPPININCRDSGGIIEKIRGLTLR